MADCLIATGSSLGDRAANIRGAINAIKCLSETRLVCASRLRETIPVGQASAERFLNGCVVVESARPPEQLIHDLLEIESGLGRSRQPNDGIDRTIDLDLVFYGHQIVNSRSITIPHPRMSFRRFVLEPASEIAGQMRHPLFDATVAGLFSRLIRDGRQIGILDFGQDSGETLRPVVDVDDLAERKSPWRVNHLDPQLPSDSGIPELNLLIESSPVSTSSDELSWPGWDGPRWQTGLTKSGEFQAQLGQLIRTAVESMQPCCSAIAPD